MRRYRQVPFLKSMKDTVSSRDTDTAAVRRAAAVSVRERMSAQDFLKTVKKFRVLFRHHKTKAEKSLILQSRKTGTVPKHKPLSDCVDKDVIGGDSFFQNTDQDKIGVRPVHFYVFPVLQFPIDTLAF